MEKRFSDEQLLGFLNEHATGVSVKHLCKKYGFADTSFYRWRTKFGIPKGANSKRLKSLANEQARFVKLLSEALLDTDPLKVDIDETRPPSGTQR